MTSLLRISGALFVTVALLATPTTGLANHSMPDPPEYWDCNGDHVADDTCVRARRAGAPWSVDSATRFATADNVWRTGTDFDIDEVTSGGQPVYRDRLGSCLTSWEPEPDFLAVAVVCVQRTWNGAQGYYKITATPTYFNHRLSDWGLSWYYGSGTPPNPDSQVHFGGVAVHELGHWILLEDLACQAGLTMCNQNQDGTQDFNQFSLETDDISGANATY